MKQYKKPPKTMIRKFTPSALCALLAFSTLGTDSCYGLSYYWLGNQDSNDNWSNPDNWYALGPPPAGSDATFDNSLANDHTPNLDINVSGLHSLFFMTTNSDVTNFTISSNNSSYFDLSSTDGYCVWYSNH